MSNEVFIRFPNISSNVSIARIAAATFASFYGFSISDIEEIKVAVSEAVSNAVLHAIPILPDSLRFPLGITNRSIEITVDDHGKGIDDLDQAKQPGFTTMPDHMGLGFTFMESFMDNLSVESAPGHGTRVRMAKNPCQ